MSESLLSFFSIKKTLMTLHEIAKPCLISKRDSSCYQNLTFLTNNYIDSKLKRTRVYVKLFNH